MQLTIATAGHIDHGKSTLVEALTGVHPDRLKEEQARGISIELGFAHAQFDEVTVAFVDVPGHERFVRHMLAGIGGIDALLCVVAADASVMPQTREHVAIAALLGVRQCVIAITKADLADTDLTDLVALESEELLRGHGIPVVQVVPVSARTGQGLDQLRQALVACARHRPERDREGPARLPVDRAFTVRGFGTVVTGTLWTGRLQVEQEIVAQPDGRTFRIRGLQVHGQQALVAEAGQRVAVNLAQATLDDIGRGATLAEDGGLLPTRRIDAQVAVLDAAAAPLRHGARVHLHVGTAMALARVAVLDPAADGATEVRPGTTGWARLRLEAPLALRRGDRFVLRSYSPVSTIAGGIVIDPAPPRRLARTAAGARLAALVAASSPAGRIGPVLAQLAADAGALGLVVPDLAPRLGSRPDQVAAALADDHGATLVSLGDVVVHRGALAALRQQVLDDVTAHHAADPDSDGLPRQSLRQRRGRRAHPLVVEHVVAGLLAEGRLVVDDDRLAHPAHRSGRVAEDAARRTMIDQAESAGLQAVTHEALLAGTDLPRGAAEAALRRLVREEAVMKLGDLYVGRATLVRLVDDLRQQRPAESTIDVGWFKERYGVTRRTAIPLLEWLDRQRVTRRVGDARVLLAP